MKVFIFIQFFFLIFYLRFLPVFMSIAVNLHSIFCGLIVSLHNFLCSSKVFSSFSVSLFPDYYNLSSSLSPIFFFRYFLFCFLSFFPSLFFQIPLFFALPLFFSIFLALFCPLTLFVVLFSSLSYFYLPISIILFLLNFPFFLFLFLYIYIYSHFFSFILCFLSSPFPVSFSLFFPIQHLSLFISKCLSPFISSKALAHSSV